MKKREPKTEGEKKVSFFDIIGSINKGTRDNDILEGVRAHDGEGASGPNTNEKAYNSFMINRGLSYFQDTVLFANEMNRYSALPPRMQYDFYRNSIRPRPRFSKWFKGIVDSADINLIKTHYQYSSEKAREVYDLFSQSQLEELRALHDKGGKE